MPSRILRDGILRSFAVNALSDDGEIFYRRLMSVVDDYGRYEADLDMLRIDLFPRKLNEWPIERVRAAFLECSNNKDEDQPPLVKLYLSKKGKQLLEIQNFSQRQRSPSKFDGPGEEYKNTTEPSMSDNDRQLSDGVLTFAASRAGSPPPTTTPCSLVSSEGGSGETKEQESAAGHRNAWAEGVYFRHPKQAYKDLAVIALCKLYDKPEDRMLFEIHYGAWVEHLTAEGAKYCPPLAKPDGSGFIADGPWRKPPPRPPMSAEEAKMAKLFGGPRK